MNRIISGLDTRAALRSGWPRLSVATPGEEALIRVRRWIEGSLGALPQADEIAPWDPEEPWELRMDLPGLTIEAWAPVAAGLIDQGWAPRLRVADPPALTEAIDRGILIEDRIGGALEVRGLVDPSGELRIPDLHRIGSLPVALTSVEAELIGALRRAIPSLVATSDRGPNTLSPVVHRPTGRVGLELDLPAGCDRHLVVEALGQVVMARARDPAVQLAPWGEVSLRRDRLQIVVYLVAPPIRALPGDTPILTEAIVSGALDPRHPLVEDLELHVVPASPADHDAVVAGVTPLAATAGWYGGPPRWVTGPAGLAFCPTWRIEGTQLASVSALSGVPGIAALRVVPGEPSGLAEAWPAVHPVWRLHGRRWFVRYRDARWDRDRLERIDVVPPDPRDHAVAASIPGDVRAMADRRGRRGLEVEIGPEAFALDGLAPILDACGAIHHPDLLPTATWGYVAAGARVRLWFRGAVRPGPRVWRGQPAPG